MKKFSALFILFSFFLIDTIAQPSEKGSYYALFKKMDRNEVSKLWAEEVGYYHLHNGIRLLDIGGSDGKMIPLIALVCDSVDYYIEDINDRYFSHVKKFMGQTQQTINTNASFGLHYILGTDSTVTAADGLFDRIVIRETIHHFTHPSQMINECKRMLAKDGNIIVSEPADHKKFKHCKLISKDRLIDMFARAGLRLTSYNKTKSDFLVYVFEKL
jgi:2-polyprenyl-3-methyl-5-hydroxy-6-metoxy-1,4-benzoquinol methylase